MSETFKKKKERQPSVQLFAERKQQDSRDAARGADAMDNYDKIEKIGEGARVRGARAPKRVVFQSFGSPSSSLPAIPFSQRAARRAQSSERFALPV